jgi:hypothetical protein
MTLAFSTRACRQTSMSACSKENPSEPASEANYIPMLFVEDPHGMPSLVDVRYARNLT